MIKTVALIARKPPLDREQFLQHWIGIHGPMVHTMPLHRGFIQAKVVREAARPDIPPLALPHEIDGIAFSWIAGEDDRKAIMNSDAGKAWWEDTKLHVGWAKIFQCGEKIVIPPRRGPAPVVKTVSLLKRKIGMTKSQFQDRWINVFASKAETMPNLRGYVLSPVLEEPAAPFNAPFLDIDGIAEIWSDSIEVRAKTFASEPLRAWYQEGADFMGGIRNWVTEEEIFIDPQN